MPGWWGAPGCGCCDGCEDCMNYEQTFDGTGTLATIDWQSTGIAARVDGEVRFQGNSPTSTIDNSPDASRLTGGVRTTFEFQLNYTGVVMGVELVMDTTGDRLYIVTETSFQIADLSDGSIIETFGIELELDTTYTFEACVDDTNDTIYAGIQHHVNTEESVSNDGLDHVKIIADIEGEYIPPIPPETEGTWNYPEDLILTVDNFRQYDRAENSSECCVCGAITTPVIPPDGVNICDMVDICDDLTEELAVTIANMGTGVGDMTCCPDLNDDYIANYSGQGGTTCYWRFEGACNPWVVTDSIGCCDEDLPGTIVVRSMLLFVMLTTTSATVHIYVTSGDSADPSNVTGYGILAIGATVAVDFATEGCDEIVVTGFTALAGFDQKCDVSTLEVTIAPVP